LPYGTTIAVAVLAIACALLLVVDLARGHRRRGTVGLILLVAFLIALYVTTGFPFPTEGRVSFGGTISVWWAIFATWLDFLRPIVVSPMVLLPLIGSLSSGPLEAIQLFSMALLAFQNGYFWQQVLKDAKPRAS
jgi:hypothetical protein